MMLIEGNLKINKDTGFIQFHQSLLVERTGIQSFPPPTVKGA